MEEHGRTPRARPYIPDLNQPALLDLNYPPPPHYFTYQHQLELKHPPSLHLLSNLRQATAASIEGSTESTPRPRPYIPDLNYPPLPDLNYPPLPDLNYPPPPHNFSYQDYLEHPPLFHLLSHVHLATATSIEGSTDTTAASKPKTLQDIETHHKRSNWSKMKKVLNRS